MSDELPPRLLEDPETPEALKEDLRRSSELKLAPELREELERLERKYMDEVESTARRGGEGDDEPTNR